MSSHNAPFELHGPSIKMVDPGDAGTITIDRNLAVVPLISAAAETRTLGRPTRQGIICTLHMQTDGGDITITVTGGYDEAGNTSMTFDDAGEFATFLSVYDGSDYYWRLIASSNGVATATLLLTDKWQIDSTGNLSSAGTPSNVTADGAVIATGGIAFTDVLNAWIDDATHGSGTTTTYIGNETVNTTSDMRVKTDIETFKGKALDVMSKAPRVVEFTYNLPGGGSVNERGRFFGFLAQEIIDVFPWVVNDNGGRDCEDCRGGKPCDEHGHWHVSYEHLVPLLVQSVLELRDELEKLKKKSSKN